MTKKQEKVVRKEKPVVEEKTLQEEKPVQNMQITHGYKWEKQRLHDRKPVKGIFRFHEVPGGSLTFSYLKYKGDPIDNFTLKDGEVYTIPLGVAKHLRNSGYYPIHAYEVDEKGYATKHVGQRVKRYTFEPLEFIADEELNNPYSGKDKDIITVTQVG